SRLRQERGQKATKARHLASSASASWPLVAARGHPEGGSGLRLWLKPARARLGPRSPHLSRRRNRRTGGSLGLLVLGDAHDLLPAQQRLDLVAGDRLVFHQRLSDRFQLLAVAVEHLARLLQALVDDAANLLIDHPRRLLGHVLALGDGV